MSKILDEVLAGTPPQFDDDESLATTEFVQRALGNFRGVQVLSASTTMTADHVGKLIVTASGSYTLTLPACSSLPDGAAIIFMGSTSSAAIIAGAGTDRLQSGALVIASLTLTEGEQLLLINRKTTGRWVAASGSAAMLGAAQLRVGGKLLVGTDVSTVNDAGTPAAEFSASDADVVRVIRENGTVNAAGGRVLLSGLNSVDEVTDYGAVDVVMEAINNGAERGAIRLRAMTAGALAEVMKINGNGDISGTVLADSTEARALAAGNRLLTPLTLNIAFTGTNQDKGASGYQKLPGGLILQWGTGTDTASNKSFPIPFPTACYAIVASQKLAAVGDASQPADAGVFIVSNSQFRVTVGDQNGVHQYYWIAIGT